MLDKRIQPALLLGCMIGIIPPCSENRVERNFRIYSVVNLLEPITQ
jgi:hypothetical protein